MPQLRAAAERAPFAADVAVFPRFQTLVDAERRDVHEPDYRGGFRIAGVKFGLDGSPQGRTAWVTEPYAEGPPGAPSDYRAYGTLDPDAYKAGAAHLIRRGRADHRPRQRRRGDRSDAGRRGRGRGRYAKRCRIIVP